MVATKLDTDGVVRWHNRHDTNITVYIDGSRAISGAVINWMPGGDVEIETKSGARFVGSRTRR